jgi:hypothetical protein
MKTIYKTLKLGMLGIFIFLSSCGYEDPITSKVTDYAVITLTGDDPAFVHIGETYTDPGAVVTVGGVEVPYDVTFVGQYRGNEFEDVLDTSISDIYSQQYSAVNDDGFRASGSRQVIVANTGDLVTSIEGVYLSTVFRNGSQGTPASNYTDIEYILIWKNDDGTYELSDSFGGWYLFGRAIPGSQTPGGIIVANDIPTNDFEFPGTQSNDYFGGTSEITSMTVDAANQTIDFVCVWQADPETTYTFEVHLEQVQF